MNTPDHCFLAINIKVCDIQGKRKWWENILQMMRVVFWWLVPPVVCMCEIQSFEIPSNMQVKRRQKSCFGMISEGNKSAYKRSSNITNFRVSTLTWIKSQAIHGQTKKQITWKFLFPLRQQFLQVWIVLTFVFHLNSLFFSFNRIWLFSWILL